MKSITLGRYYQKESIIHSLDPRTKLVFLLLYIANVFYFNSISTLLLSAVFLFSLILLSRVPLSYFFRGTGKLIILFSIFGLLILLTEENGERKAIFMIVRMVLVLLSSTLLTLTTRPKKIAEGIEKALGKGVLKKNIHVFATIIMIAFRFLPILSDEANKIIEAQKSRGLDFEQKNIFTKARLSLSILVPLFVSAYKRADELAYAMDNRAYSSNGETTSLYPLKYKRSDYISYVAIFAFLAINFSLERFLWI